MLVIFVTSHKQKVGHAPCYKLGGFGIFHEQPMGRGGLPGVASPVVAWSWCRLWHCDALAMGGTGGASAGQGCRSAEALATVALRAPSPIRQ